MTDLHTHILPGVDDGAKTVTESLKLLRMEWNQGVDTVVLTPHFYRDREPPERFLRRRREAAHILKEAVINLPETSQRKLPKLYLGAEVAWWPDLDEWEELPQLCIGKTRNLLLELPFSPWNDRMFSLLHDLMGKTGITPVIAHLDRYLKIQRPEHIREVLNLGVPVQMSGDVLLKPFRRGTSIKLLRNYDAHFIASDCHGLEHRKPNLAEAMEVVRKKLGDRRAEELIWCADELVRPKAGKKNAP